jgi:hypothetical protein
MKRPIQICFAASVGVLVFSLISSADSSLDSLTSAGSGNISEGLSYSDNGDSSKNDEGLLGWGLGYTFSHQDQPATPTSQQVIDNSSGFQGNISYKDRWEVGGGLSYSTTPAENLHSVGPNVFVGYLFKSYESKKPPRISTPAAASQLNSDAEDSSETDRFHPSLELKMGLGWLNFTEDLSGATARTPAKRAALAALEKASSVSIAQTGISPEADYSPLDWLSLRAVYTHYKYNKDVASFLKLLDSPRAVSIGASNFGSTLSGFPSYTLEFDAMFNFLDDWSFTPTYIASKNADDGSKGTTLKAMLNRNLGDHWRAGLGFEHDKADGFIENLVLASIGYDF